MRLGDSIVLVLTTNYNVDKCYLSNIHSSHFAMGCKIEAPKGFKNTTKESLETERG